VSVWYSINRATQYSDLKGIGNNMTKKELVQLYKDGKLEVTAQCGVTGFQVVEVVHGITDKVFGFFQYAEDKSFHLVAVSYHEKAFVKVGNERIYMENCLRFF
jgi:hypothetical protein